jgi:hypothetical protein
MDWLFLLILNIRPRPTHYVLGGSHFAAAVVFLKLYSPNITLVIKYRRMRWAGHVARVGVRCGQGFGGET